MYINSHTFYSICYGTMDIPELLELAGGNGCTSIALTDINSTSACVDFVRKAAGFGIKPVIGVDFRIGVKQQFIALARDNDGFYEINTFLTQLLHDNLDCPDIAPEFRNVFVIYPFERGKARVLRNNEFTGLRISDIPFVRIKKIPTEKMVVLQTVSFRSKRDFNAHRLLRAIDKNTLLSKLDKNEQGKEEHRMLPLDELRKEFELFPEVLRNTEQMLDSCSVYFDFSPTRSENKRCYLDSQDADWELLRQLCEQGLKYRYPEPEEPIRARIEKELQLIRQMGFVSYFLINWDIVSYARSKDYFYVGRGSGANSVVAYLLRITDVDPIELDLYFERFINLYRTNPPDFDIDFSWTDRDDVTRYIFERFGNVALVATYNTFRDRAVIRELGKVFGLPKEEIDKLVRPLNRNEELSQLAKLVLKYGDYIRNFPSHLSIHASGIVISEKPVNHFTATFMPPKGYPTIMFDMHVAEDMGWFKFDILSQRGLSKIKDSLGIIAYNQPELKHIDIHDIKRFKEDERIRKMLREATAIGCFYVESPAMRMLLSKLQVDNYLGLVAASSVIRPGVAKSGMMGEYIKRMRNPEKRKEAHPVLLELMPETFGVMVYQEDVIKVAHHFAGLSLGEADKMRRGMSGKFRSRDEFQSVKNKFFANCREKGHSDELTAEIWRQTESFAGYAFAKGHSASYAVESYQCLFLKAYFPLEFMVATINNYGGFYRTELYVLEAKSEGGTAHPPCVNKSRVETCIDGKDIYLGFHLLHSFEHKIAVKIVEEREMNGVFADFDDFTSRVRISLEQIAILIRIDAFRFTGKNKRTLLWEAHVKVNKIPDPVDMDLFRIQSRSYTIPELINTEEENTFDQIELLGFPIRSMFDLALPDNRAVVLAADLPLFKEKQVWIRGYLIHAKKTITSDGKLMFFGTFLDECGEWLDTVHFPIIAAKYPFRGSGVYLIYGKVIEEYDFLSVEAEYMEKMPIIEDPRYSEVKTENKSVVTSNSRKDYWDRSRK